MYITFFRCGIPVHQAGSQASGVVHTAEREVTSRNLDDLILDWVSSSAPAAICTQDLRGRRIKLGIGNQSARSGP